MAFKDRLKEARLNNGMTQEQVAEKIGVAKSTFTGYEKGNSEPSMYTISKIMHVLKIDANFLWQDEMGSNYPMKVSLEELEYIKKYRSLDDPGRSHVNTVLQWECDRVKKFDELSSQPAAIISIEDHPGAAKRLIEYFHSVSAGSGVFILGNEVVDHIEIPATPENRNVDYAIKVSGNSMEPDYHDGDTVLVSQKQEMQYGDVGIFVINGSAYIKEYGKDELISRNPDFDNISVSEYDNIVCMGKVIGKLTD